MAIFVVDDEPTIAATTAAILRLQGYSTVCFTDPQDAVEAVKCSCPRLLIADIIMPTMSGVELAIRTKELCSDCGVILFTGQASISELLNEPRELGFTILHKPARAQDLLGVVNRLIGVQ